MINKVYRAMGEEPVDDAAGGGDDDDEIGEELDMEEDIASDD